VVHVVTRCPSVFWCVMFLRQVGSAFFLYTRALICLEQVSLHGVILVLGLGGGALVCIKGQAFRFFDT